MSYRWVLCAAAVLFAAQAPARASFVFTSVLSGDSERPEAVTGTGISSATAVLRGDAGNYTLSYTLNYTGLGSAPVGGAIHYSISPVGRDPAEQTGPGVHALDADFSLLGTDGSISGQWRFDDATLPLTDALADSLLDGELYFNLYTAGHAGGEIRGQLLALGGEADAGAAPPNATAIPLPPALLLGLAGLAGAGYATRRRRSITR